MKKNFEIEIPALPKEQWDYKGRIYSEYQINAISADDLIAYLKVRTNKTKDTHRQSPPVVVYQFTSEEYRGRGINVELLIRANQWAIKKFRNPLHSDTIFKDNPSKNPQYHKKPAKRVWEKLEQRGLAKKISKTKTDQWQML